LLSLRDFFHLPQLDPLIERIINEPDGLLVIAGLDPRPLTGTSSGFLPSGRHALFGLMVDSILAAQEIKKCIVVTTDKQLVRVPRQFRRRVQIDHLRSTQEYGEQIAAATLQRPGMIVVDRLCPENVIPALQAARQGLRVLAQLDTIFFGSEILPQLIELGASESDLGTLRWVLAIQRLPSLCPKCKQSIEPTAVQLDRMKVKKVSSKSMNPEFTLYRSVGCAQCQGSGRLGDVAIFDVFHLDKKVDEPGLKTSLLSMEDYVWELVQLGYLTLEDWLDFESNQFRRTFNLFIDRERALTDTKLDLESRLIQLQAAHKVLQQRTEALVSLQTIGQSMIATDHLEDLADRLCRHAGQLCGAEQAILYYQRFAGQVEVLAFKGWDPTLVGKQVEMSSILDAQVGPQPVDFNRLPPGVSPSPKEEESWRAGLAVSLYAQNEWVGLMILHTSQKDRFLPGEVALLQTFANQAALAIQRAGLVAQLRDKITQLEAAQIGLAQKERLEREMELARQVQQSLLPRNFPHVEGFQFAAQCEPARQVGGDFYDIIPLEEGRFGVAIGDVSDKGMPAALYMTLTRSLLRAEAHRDRSPRSVLKNVNHLLLELGEPNLYVTLFYGVVEPRSHQFIFARAGHERPYLVRDGQLHPLEGEGIPLALLEEAEFSLTEQSIRLAQGDKLLLYTDGLTDVLNSEGQLFERSGLEQLFLTQAHLTPNALCGSVFDALNRYRGVTEPFDDMTILVVEME
jgi:sigma-B regulation protein RsbU (phosphoserine phosphatase)